MERALTVLLRADENVDLHGVRLADLPEAPSSQALSRRREALGLSLEPSAPVLVDEHGTPFPREEIPLRLRFARSVRISIEGNSHFCRGLLRTRYPESTVEVSA
jgi:hypothetical protein